MRSLFSVPPQLHHSITSSADRKQETKMQQPRLTAAGVLPSGDTSFPHCLDFFKHLNGRKVA